MKVIPLHVCAVLLVADVVKTLSVCAKQRYLGSCMCTICMCPLGPHGFMHDVGIGHDVPPLLGPHKGNIQRILALSQQVPVYGKLHLEFPAIRTYSAIMAWASADLDFHANMYSNHNIQTRTNL